MPEDFCPSSTNDIPRWRRPWASLKVHELLVELAKARLNFLEVVREPLDLRGHGVQARAGVGLHVLHGFLQRSHAAAEVADIVIETADDGLDDGVILGHLRGEIFLPLQQGSDIALEVDDFAGDGFGRMRTDEASTDGAGKNGCTKNCDIAYTHDKPS